MTYANECRPERRAYHYRQEESLAFVLALVVVIVVAACYYILWNRFHIRRGQLIELSLYAVMVSPPWFPLSGISPPYAADVSATGRTHLYM